jgi:hypothetical protein
VVIETTAGKFKVNVFTGGWPQLAHVEWLDSNRGAKFATIDTDELRDLQYAIGEALRRAEAEKR